MKKTILGLGIISMLSLNLHAGYNEDHAWLMGNRAGAATSEIVFKNEAVEFCTQLEASKNIKFPGYSSSWIEGCIAGLKTYK